MSAPSSSNPNADRVAVVTGATRGIGLSVAHELASRGFTTVVVGRGVDRVQWIAAEIARTSGNPRVEPLGLEDLAVRTQAKAVANELLARFPAIHVLVNNAGAYFSRREVTPDGLERTFALNVLAPFALTSLLADRMRVSAPARVVQVTSAAHLGQRVDFADLQSVAAYRGFEAYGRSKLELLLLTREFARRLRGTGVVVNAVHPGFVRSGFGDNNPGGAGFGVRVAKLLFAHSLGYGMRNVVFVATDPGAGAVTGEYFSRHRVARASPESYDMVAARRLYDACRELAGTPELPDPPPPPIATPPAAVPPHPTPAGAG